MQRTLGTCYYPEHWPQDVWAEDARRMVDDRPQRSPCTSSRQSICASICRMVMGR